MVRRWVPALVLGGVWWWAVLRIVLEPERTGLVEGAVAAGGWGLSLLPVHVAGAVRPSRASGETAGESGRKPTAGDVGAGDAGPGETAGGAGPAKDGP